MDFLKKYGLNHKFSFFYYDCIVFLLFLAVAVTALSGGFRSSCLLGLVTSLLVFFLFDFFLVIYVIFRKLVFLIYCRFIFPLLEALNDYRKELGNDR